MTRFETLLVHDRFWVAVGLGGVVVACWAWLIPASIDMRGDMHGLAAWMMDARWNLSYGVLIFAMWAVMMIGMMLPSAAPTLFLFGHVVCSDARVSAPLLRVYAFAIGYLLAWGGFSLIATLLQWGLARSVALTPMMQLHSPALGGTLLVLAGIYQWTPLKRACLASCRAPAQFISASWRPGLVGALRMGCEHGLYCLGCCWALMLLLFVGGVMNLTWIVAITVAVLAEKIAPRGMQTIKISGLLLICAGIAIALEAERR